MAFCTSCGRPVADDAAFCTACGTQLAQPPGQAGAGPDATVAMPPETPTAVVPPPEPTMAVPPVPPVAPAQPPYTPAQQAYQPPYQPPYGPPAQASPPPYQPPYAANLEGPPKKSRSGLIAIIVALVAVAVIAVGAVYFLTRDKGSGTAGKTTGGSSGTGGSASTTPSGTTLAAQIAGILTPVSEAQAAADTAVSHLQPTTGSLAQAQGAGQDLGSAVSTAQSAAGGIQGGTPEETSLLQAVTDALTAQAQYAQALQGLPATPEELTAGDAQAVASAGNAAADAYGKLQGAAGGAAELSGLTAGPAGFDHVVAVAKKAVLDRAINQYLQTVEKLFVQSGVGRNDLVAAVGGVRGMSMDPNTAGGKIDRVYQNRKAVLRKVRALRPPADARSKRVKALFLKAATYSLRADNSFAYWILDVHDYYYRSPVGYQGHVPLNSSYTGGVKLSTQASSYKTQLVAVYNKLAKQFGMKHNWTARDI